MKKQYGRIYIDAITRTVHHVHTSEQPIQGDQITAFDELGNEILYLMTDVEFDVPDNFNRVVRAREFVDHIEEKPTRDGFRWKATQDAGRKFAIRKRR